MKCECWLKPNRRALGIAMILPAIVAVIALAMVLLAPAGGVWEVIDWVGWILMAGALIAAGSLGYLMRTPRLGYQDGKLLVYLRGFEAERVPIECVECFFLGQGPSYMPQKDEKPSETSTIVVRLAEAAQEWRHVDVKPTLGHWCDGYITIRGTWCEPINASLMKRLNERLAATHRERREQAKQESA